MQLLQPPCAMSTGCVALLSSAVDYDAGEDAAWVFGCIVHGVNGNWYNPANGMVTVKLEESASNVDVFATDVFDARRYPSDPTKVQREAFRIFLFKPSAQQLRDVEAAPLTWREVTLLNEDHTSGTVNLLQFLRTAQIFNLTVRQCCMLLLLLLLHAALLLLLQLLLLLRLLVLLHSPK